jgi:polar amino acid transport system ATP-binding protein
MTTGGSDGPVPAIEVRDLHKSFGDLEVLKGFDFHVNEGEVVCVIGPSGSGKSTLLRCVNRLEEPTSGQIFIEGEDITDIDADVDELRSRIGMVFQSFNLFPHLSVMRNLTIAQRRVRVAARPRPWRWRATTSSGWGCSTRSTPTPPTSPAGSSSASRSPARCRWTPT